MFSRAKPGSDLRLGGFEDRILDGAPLAVLAVESVSENGGARGVFGEEQFEGFLQLIQLNQAEMDQQFAEMNVAIAPEYAEAKEIA